MSMAPRPKLSIIIPVYNERESVGVLHRELVEVLTPLREPFEILFVDDGSTDGTGDALRKLKPARVLSFVRNFGKSQALQAGFDAAMGDYLITLDGDLQDDPHEIPDFVARLASADLVVGWKQRRADPFEKRFFSKIANAVTASLTGVRVHDMNCGLKGFRRGVAKALRLHGDMHRYIPALAAGLGFLVAELPVHHRPRRFGTTKYGAWRLLAGLFDFFTLVFLRRFIDRPMHFFGLLGAALAGLGFLVLAYLTWLKLVESAVIGDRPLLLLGVLLIIVGFQSLSLGLVGELVIRQGPDAKRSYVLKEE